VLELRHLHKTYGDLVAVKDLSFRLEPGDIFGFIGSNGAGKTTTIRMIATLIEPTEGTASLNGVDIRKSPMEIRRMIGYMPDFFGLYEDVKVWEYLDFFAAVYRVPPRDRKKTINNVLELTNLTGKRDSLVQSLSRGMQQRLCLARCLVHDPDLLLLDEPASGLDPRARAEFRELMIELGKMGKIILVSSHILPELSGFCNKVGIFEKGEMLALGPVDKIVKAMRKHRVIVVKIINQVESAANFLGTLPNVPSVKIQADNALRVEFSGTDEEQAQILIQLVQAGFLITAFSEDQLNLEDVFMKLTTGALN